MFTLKLHDSEEKNFNNYLKYIIILRSRGSYYFYDNKSTFYYLITSIKYCISTSYKFPAYLIAPILYIDRYNEDDKFNLSKLGTDYVVNKLGLHYQSECIGEYPDRYIFKEMHRHEIIYVHIYIKRF